jgi:drug/metabolite transporter (DMT)-like permease
MSFTIYAKKSTPKEVNPFSALIITYLIAIILNIIFFQLLKDDQGFFQSLKDLNWTSIFLGFSIVGLELGYLMAYRSGWKISVGSLVANIALALMLIPIGILFYKEGFGLYKVFGSAFCIIGLILINK